MVSWIRTEDGQYIKASVIDALKIGSVKRHGDVNLAMHKIDQNGDYHYIGMLFWCTEDSFPIYLENLMAHLTNPEHGPILDVNMEVL